MDKTIYLIDESNNLAPEPGQIQRANIEPIQHDHTIGWVVETLQ